MKFRFLLDDVEIKEVDTLSPIKHVTYTDDFVQLNQECFEITIPNVAVIQAEKGKNIHVKPLKNYDLKIVEMYLNGSVMGAILHQRLILPIHASSFRILDKSVMICGESGAGKSTLTAAMIQKGANFITDDITPVILQNNEPFIWAISDSIKLWQDSLEELSIPLKSLTKISTKLNKYFFTVENTTTDKYIPISVLLQIKKGGETGIKVRPIEGVEKFQFLLDQIYRKEYLAGLEEAKIKYLKDMTTICELIPFYEVTRADDVSISEFQSLITSLITNQVS